jgi:carbamoyltransferase
MSVILGLNAYHADSAACVVVDGRLRAAAEEERFRRVKHWAGLPTRAVDYCLREVGASLADVDHVAVNTNRRANAARKLSFVLRQRPDPGLLLQRLGAAQKRASLAEELHRQLPGERFTGRVHQVEHHLSHLASAYYAGPHNAAALVSVDGFGDFASGAWGTGREGRLEVGGRVHFPHSLGIFYQAMTQYLGFPNYGDEYKVMGLAPYGQPRFLSRLREVVRLNGDGSFALDLRFFRHHREKVAYEWAGGAPVVGRLYSEALEDLLGPARDPDEPLQPRQHHIARSTQAMYEEAYFHLLRALHDRYGGDRLCVAGGCGMNSVANGKIRLRTPFRHVYVQPAAGDAGGALGAAFVVAQRVEGGVLHDQMPHAYWGPAASGAEVDALLQGRASELRAAGCRVTRVDDEDALSDQVAAAIADGAVVGWFQGRMEWGPRALGNRSILCDPRRADMKDVLNLKIKRRESFRPFAPSVLAEAAADWFEQDDDVPFMMKVFQIRPERREQIPAVTHVDGSGRLQTVSKQHNPRYHRLITAFRDRTGVPMVLNTSFNENEPVVCRPVEALECFLRTRMDLLVLDTRIIRRAADR